MYKLKALFLAMILAIVTVTPAMSGNLLLPHAVAIGTTTDQTDIKYGPFIVQLDQLNNLC